MKLKDTDYMTYCSSYRSPSLKAKTELSEALADYKRQRPNAGVSIEKLNSMLKVLRVVADNGGILQDDLGKLVNDLEAFLFCDKRRLAASMQAKVYDYFTGKAYADAASEASDRIPYFYLHIVALDCMKELTHRSELLQGSDNLKTSSTAYTEITEQLLKLEAKVERYKALVSDLESQTFSDQQRVNSKKRQVRRT